MALCQLSVSKRGFGYKRKKSIRPREPPAADVRSIQEVLNLALPAGFRIREVQDQGKKILIVMEEINHENFEELAGGLQRSLARGIGSIAASYQCYLARANALAVAQARTAEEIQFVANWMATFAYLLWYAIGATNELTHLVVPASFEDLYIEQPVRRGNNGVLVLRFSGWCRPGFDMEVKSLVHT